MNHHPASLILASALLLGSGFLLGRLTAPGEAPPPPGPLRPDTVRLVRVDTLRLPRPAAAERAVLRVDTLYLPLAPQGNATGPPDSARVLLGREQKVYRDSLYTAYVSGHRPRLDSIALYPRSRTLTITRTAPRPAPRWSLGLQLGAGLGPGGCGPYLGIGLSYRLWPR